MKDRSRWSRREFVQMAGSSLGAMSLGLPSLAHMTGASGRVAPRFAYVGFGGEGAKERVGFVVIFPFHYHLVIAV